MRTPAWALICVGLLAGCASQVEFLSRNVRVGGQLSKPDSAGPHPAVVLLHTCGGITRHVAQDWPHELVKLGYVVLAVNTLGSRTGGDCRALPNRLEVQAQDAYAALDYLAVQPFVDARRIAAVGFSMGATTINELIMLRPPRPAGQPEYKAFAAFYGKCDAMNAALLRDARLLQIIPEHDDYAYSCIARSKMMPMEAHVLPGAYHGFDQPQFARMGADPSGNKMLYDYELTRRSATLLREFLAKSLN